MNTASNSAAMEEREKGTHHQCSNKKRNTALNSATLTKEHSIEHSSNGGKGKKEYIIDTAINK